MGGGEEGEERWEGGREREGEGGGRERVGWGGGVYCYCNCMLDSSVGDPTLCFVTVTLRTRLLQASSGSGSGLSRPRKMQLSLPPAQPAQHATLPPIGQTNATLSFNNKSQILQNCKSQDSQLCKTLVRVFPTPTPRSPPTPPLHTLAWAGKWRRSIQCRTTSS